MFKSLYNKNRSGWFFVLDVLEMNCDVECVYDGNRSLRRKIVSWHCAVGGGGDGTRSKGQSCDGCDGEVDNDSHNFGHDNYQNC